MTPFVTVGAAAVIAGGGIAAIARPTGWDDASWVAAFLVLVVGVGQIGLGAGQAALDGVRARSERRLAAQVAGFNAAAATVLVGTLLSAPAVVTAGGAALVVALASFVRPVRACPPGRRWLGRVYSALLIVLLVSAPVGLALSWSRS